MKKILAIAVCVLTCLSAFLTGCAPNNNKSPDQNKKIRWETPDYSFIINPADDCKGVYRFNGVKYNIKANFDGDDLSVVDTSKSNTELFYAKWTYDGDDLYIYDITFNKEKYKDFKENYSEYVKLQKGKIR